jgi:hypothetical protein
MNHCTPLRRGGKSPRNWFQSELVAKVPTGKGSWSTNRREASLPSKISARRRAPHSCFFLRMRIKRVDDSHKYLNASCVTSILFPCRTPATHQAALFTDLAPCFGLMVIDDGIEYHRTRIESIKHYKKVYLSTVFLLLRFPPYLLLMRAGAADFTSVSDVCTFHLQFNANFIRF